MKVVIVGAAGFVGKNLSLFLLSRGFDIIGIDIADFAGIKQNKKYRYIKADTTKCGLWQKSIFLSDAVVNLAGKNIFGYWTQSFKQKIYKSRILTTKNIVDSLSEGNILINASAVGIYGDRNDEELYEKSLPGNDFLAKTCKDWEAEAFKAVEKNTRLIILRFGIIIGKNGGALKRMLPAYKMGMGSTLGSGTQWFAWIHQSDLLEIIYSALIKDEASGIYNCVSPSLVTQSEFSKNLAAILGKKEFLPVPLFFLKLFLGDLGIALTASQKVIPIKLVDLGFCFKYNNIYKALHDSVN